MNDGTPTDQLSERVLRAVAVECEARGWRPLALWLFGSRAKGTARPDSDIDIAVLFEQSPGGDLLAAQDTLARRERVELDLIDLGAAPPELAWEVITCRPPAIENDERAVERFVRRARYAVEDSERRNRMILLAQLPPPDSEQAQSA